MIVEKGGADYSKYVELQGRKINSQRERFIRTIPKRIKKFKRFFSPVLQHINPGRVLCLGARTGCEVKAFIELGFKDSVGIDLHPAQDFVLVGDWHNLQFPDNSFKNIFTNAIDHCFDLTKMINEIKRVLIPGGIFFLAVSKHQMLVNHEDRELYMKQKGNNFLFWATNKDLAEVIQKFGFTLKTSIQVGKNWEYLVFKKEN